MFLSVSIQDCNVKSYNATFICFIDDVKTQPRFFLIFLNLSAVPMKNKIVYFDLTGR